MKKTIILIIIIALFTSAILFLAVITQENKNKREIFENELSSIPHIELCNIAGDTVKLREICISKKTVIVHFDVNCEICHIEAREFSYLQNEFSDCSVIFISNNNLNEIKTFISENGLESSNYIFLVDKKHLMVTNYDIPTIPYMLLYINNKLQKSYKGGINIKQIIKDKNDRQS